MDELKKIITEAKRDFAMLVDKRFHFVGIDADEENVYLVGETGDGNMSSPGFATQRFPWRKL